MSIDAAVRAGLVLLVVGCGDDAGSLPDAPGETVIDAETGPELVKVTITDRGVPAVGATVYFQKPDSSVVRMSTTDLDGIARAPMPDGGFVTVIEPRPMAFGPIVIRDRLATFAGVKPGDDLHLDVRPVLNPTSISPRVQVPADPGADRYELFSTCGRATLGMEAATTPTPVVLTDCGGIADIVVISTDFLGQPLRGLYRAGQPLADGATVTFTEPYTDLVPTAVSITGSPAWVGNYAVQLELVTSRGPMYSLNATIDPATPMMTCGLPPTTGTSLRVRTDIYGAPPAVSRQTVVAWDLPVSNQVVDAAASVLRPMTSMPVFDPATHTVTWTEDPGRNPDVVRAEIYAYRDGDPAHAWSWQLVAPYENRTSVTYPTLPEADGTAFTTLATDSFSVIDLETLAIGGGYDRVRAHALRRALDVVPSSGPAGQLTYQHLYEMNLLATPTLRAPAAFTRATR